MLKSLKKYFLPTFVLFTFLACDRTKRKADIVIEHTKEKLIAKKDAALDKIIPTFDSYKPDSKFNRKRFTDFFGFAPTADVRELYCYGDHLGIDGIFMFSFRCDTTTKNRIVRHLSLVQSDKPDNFGSGLWQPFPWWDSAKIVTLNPYLRRGEHEFYKYLWYDKDKSKVYYIDFDM